MKSHQRQPSLDFSVQSSEDGRAANLRRDLDTVSQDSRNGETSPLLHGPAARAAVHKGALSEPVRRAFRVRIHEPAEMRRGIFSRMSSTDSHHGGESPGVTAESCQMEASAPENQGGVKEELNDPPEPNGAEQEAVWTSEPSLKVPAEPEPEPETGTEPDQPAQTECRIESLLPQPPLQHGPRSPPLIAPSSPARVRRTLQAPAAPRPSTPMRTQARSSSCPRKQTSSQTPVVNRKPLFHWQTQYGSYQVRPIPNGLCLSDSSSCSSGSSGSSTDSLEFVPSCEQHEGTLQREMKALFDEKMREVRCKSPLFLHGESWMIWDL